ncbi:hypothetical protein L6452_07882 [Arctium lappa]|uniref:Uncharacterized protein n=1 Tax=Arctium lappa TaxID=4217 RepID=A0ACB9ELJ7_ARCLA|nr:hypothetical protein L6452_07882 [Arctium lappa]
MDLKTSNYLHTSHPHHQGVQARKEDPFEDSHRFPDNLCKLSLKESSNLVKLFPMGRKDKSNVVEAPPTPGRPVFSFSVGSRKNFPSKWDDAEKWVISGSDSPAHNHHHNQIQGFVKSPDFVSKHSSNNGFVVKQGNLDKTEVSTEEKVSKAISVFQVPTTVSMEQDHHEHNSTRPFNGISPSDSSDVLLKDKFTNGVEPNVSRFKCLVPINQGCLFSHLHENSMKDASTEVVHEVKHKETGTNMTPVGSSSTSRWPTPVNCSSPPRHNTPANMSGPLALLNPSSSFDIAELQECHLAKLQLETPFDSVACNWSSREEEEEDVSKSLRHFEMNNECTKSIQEPRACAWDEEGKNKSHLRYQREEAKIQAWVNLQNAKAEAQSRKLEVKIQKMRSKFEEKMMKRMSIVHRKAEELRAAAQREHNVQIQKTNVRATKKINVHESMHFSGYNRACGCFPCSNLHP